MKPVTQLIALVDSKTGAAPAVPAEDLWLAGWTHRRMTGQTKARMNKLTLEVEIRELGQWIKCSPGAHLVFSPRHQPARAAFLPAPANPQPV